jgi:DNA adenine methylase
MLHFFHRARLHYLENYQVLVMAEPESAVSQALKEVFLTLRVAAENVK